MEFVKYIKPKTGLLYTAYQCEEDGVTGYRQGIEEVEGYTEIDKSVFTTEPLNAEKYMLNYANDNNLIPASIKRIVDDPKLTFQGEIVEAKDYKKLSADDLQERIQEYIALKDEAEEMADSLTAELKRVKEEYARDIGHNEKKMQELEPIFRSGCEAETCEASWERDAAAEKMILVRRDNLRILQIREMTADEKHPDIFDNVESENEPDTAEEPTTDEESNETVSD